MSEDIEVHVAGGPLLRGRAANLDAWETQMQDRGFGGYVRSTEVVHVAADGRTANERGQWVGRWRQGGRTREQHGQYTAEWRLGPMGWEITRETYIER
jgi:ketosteroid isomerase-like protein